MGDDGTEELVDDGDWVSGVERAVLSDSVEGRAIAAAFITAFGDFVAGTIRPILRGVADAGGEPQLLVNGLAQMLRDVADTMEFAPGERSSAHPPDHDAGDDPGPAPTAF
jgi:hypothetical protein